MKLLKVEQCVWGLALHLYQWVLPQSWSELFTEVLQQENRKMPFLQTQFPAWTSLKLSYLSLFLLPLLLILFVLPDVKGQGTCLFNASGKHQAMFRRGVGWGGVGRVVLGVSPSLMWGKRNGKQKGSSLNESLTYWSKVTHSWYRLTQDFHFN